MEKILLNKLKIVNNIGISLIMKKDIISPMGFVIDSNSLSSCLIKKHTLINFKNFPIGRITGKSYSEQDGELFIHFVLNENDYVNYIYDNQDKFIIIPQFQAKKIICPVCLNSFSIGQTSCECIYISEVVIIKSPEITGVNLYDCSVNIPVFKERENLLNEFFGGAVGNLLE